MYQLSKNATGFLVIVRRNSGPIAKLSLKNYIIHVGGPHSKIPIIDSYEKITLCIWGGSCYKVPIINSYEEKITSYIWEDPVTRFPSLTVTRFPVHVGDPTTWFLSLTVTRFPHANHVIHVGETLLPDT